MAISVNRVYSTVQRILNVEQRGQLPPEDFNEFASLAQMELYNELFFDEAHFANSAKRTSAIMDDIDERLAVFIKSSVLLQSASGSNIYSLPEDLYSLIEVYCTDLRGTTRIAEMIKQKGSRYIMSSNLTKPTSVFPKYKRMNNNGPKGIGQIAIYPTPTGGNVTTEYFKTPDFPKWNFINIGLEERVPIFDSTSSINFDLHPSMEDELIIKILFYAGLSIKQETIAAAAAQEEASNDASEKS